MRIADRSTARNYLKYLNQAKADLAETNERIASGKKFEKMSDDVAAGTRAMRTRAEKVKAETQYGNVKAINEELTVAETAMSAINDAIKLVYGERLNAAMSEEKGESGRLAIANEIKAVRQQILQLANTKHSARYVFGGTNAGTEEPFSLNEQGRLLYNGIAVDDIRQRADGTFFYENGGVETEIPMDEDVFIDIGLGIRMNGARVDPDTAFKVSYSGLSILGFGKKGNDPQGQPNNILNVLTDIEANIRNFNLTALNSYHTQLGALADKFRANLTDIGAKTSFLEGTETRLKDMIDHSQKKISGLMGVDDAEESIKQGMNEYVLKAVIQMGARLLPVSLMDFLK